MKKSVEPDSWLTQIVVFGLLIVGAVFIARLMQRSLIDSLKQTCETHCVSIGLNYTASSFPDTCICEVNTAILKFSKSYDPTCFRKIGDWYQCDVQKILVIQ